MINKILLKGGPANGESLSVDSELNYVRICKIADTSGIILTDSNSTCAVDVVEKSYGYRQSNDDKLIYLYDEE